MERAILLAAAASALAALPAQTQAQTQAQTPPTEVDEVIITATRLEAPRDITPGAHVIDEAEIEASGAVFVSELLGRVPGVSLYSQGAPGGVTSVRLRGAAQDKTLVLLDGVALNDPSQPAGGYDFAALDLGDIARIEVLNGPQGSLWGSDAIGGVIALTSRELDGARLDLEAGSFDTLRGAAAWGVATDRFAFGLHASTYDTDGVSRADAADGNTEADGFENRTVALNGRISAGPFTIDGRLRWNDAVAQIDGFPAPSYVLADTDEVSDTESRSGFLRARASVLGFEHALTWSRSRIDRAITGGAFPSRYAGERSAWRWQADNALVAERLGLAVGLEREDTQGDLSTGTPAELGATSAFAAARLQASERLVLSASVRLDDPDEYDAETTLRAGAALALTDGLTLAASWGQGFKTPTISQTLCDFCFSFSPYPTLRPERAEGFDLGLSWRAADGRAGLSVTGYRLKVEDEISFFFDTGTFESYYVNVAQTRATGVEIEADWRLGEALGVSAAYAWTDAEDQDGDRLPRVPEHAGSVTLDWTAGPWRAAFTVRGESDQADVGGTRDAFVTARLAGGYQLGEGAELTLRVENLSDEPYQEVFGYGEAGRAVYGGIRLRY